MCSVCFFHQRMADRSNPSVTLRRAHKKARTGCKTCRSRHVRCDETFPRCQNCKRGSRLCSYGIGWDQLGDFPPQYDAFFRYPRPMDPAGSFHPVEFRLLQHVVANEDMRILSSNCIYSQWARKIPHMVSEHRFVLDCLLSNSATHYTSLTNNPKTAQLALYYRNQGLIGLRRAVGNFSESNADALIAASILLIWYAYDWNEWSSLMSGFNALVGSMQTYKAQSSFIDLIEEEAIIPVELQPLPLSCTETKPPTTDDIEALNDLYARLHDVRTYVNGHQVEAGFIGKIIDFITMLQLKSPIISPQEQFMASKWLRPAIISLPISIMQRLRRGPEAMIAAAYFHAAILVVQPFFPALGAMFFGRMAFSPISEISRFMEEQRNHPVAGPAHEWAKPSALMVYVQKSVQHFRTKLGWPTEL